MARDELNVWRGVAERESARRQLAAAQAASFPYMEENARGAIADTLNLRTMTATEQEQYFASQRESLRKMLKR